MIFLSFSVIMQQRRENVPEYKKKYGGKSRVKVYHSSHSLAVSPIFLFCINHLQTRYS